MKNYGDDEAVDDVLVAIGRCEKREKFVHNVCLLIYYCYLCGNLEISYVCFGTHPAPGCSLRDPAFFIFHSEATRFYPL